MFCTAEVAGGTLILLPEARYKTSFYSMLGVVGQTQEDALDRVARAPRPRLLTLIASTTRARASAPHKNCRASPESCPKRAVQRSVLDGFGDVFGLDGGGAFEVGDRAGYF